MHSQWGWSVLRWSRCRSQRDAACRLLDSVKRVAVMPPDKTDQHRPSAAHTSPFASSFFSPAKVPVASKNTKSLDKPESPAYQPSKANVVHSHERQVQGTPSTHTKPSPVRAPHLPQARCLFTEFRCVVQDSVRATGIITTVVSVTVSVWPS